LIYLASRSPRRRQLLRQIGQHSLPLLLRQLPARGLDVDETPHPGEPAADFVIAGPQTHGVAGLVNLFGIESPGLTATLAIAEDVRMALSSPP